MRAIWTVYYFATLLPSSCAGSSSPRDTFSKTSVP
ncbi:hypothetical protein DUNSADRAFT_2059 [Dunaliella salina]|uniref:Encoded protein n=1 Tax=Dunaliella salina TaxID=3046 RepID=A0ABQ7FWQ2_DUNSA|nr:hypothetical protein DUNSADRAFT_2059 [Dunaliella salina]|eukprot:KAF5826787.1 hypothetical protein DUNSADRAFT_2059 [Dunaliella salina]